jgi:putative ABC transport system permease protein
MKVLNRKLARHLRQSWGQVLAITAVLACGSATYICFSSVHRNLLLTRDTYYAQYRFADFFIMLEEAPLRSVLKVENLPGVRAVRGRIVKDVNLDLPNVDEPRVGRIISMPDWPEPVINDICLMSGRYFSEGAQDEAIVCKSFADANRLALGERIQASIDNRKYSLKIVGTALSPEYVYMIRSAAEFVPSPEHFGVLWVPKSLAENALNMQDACNEAVGLLDGSKPVEEVLDSAEKILEPYGVYAKVKRYDQISNRFLSDEISGIRVQMRVTPAIFMGIAALALLVLLNRMVTNERTEIGLFKAYGYSTWAVSVYYLKFAVILGAIGGIAGCVLGLWIAKGLVSIYVGFFQFPILRARVYPHILAQATAICLACALIGALAAVRKAATIQPAQAMRVAAPRYGYRTLIERIPVLWRMLSFTWKMVIRNVSRYRWRAFASVLGITVSAGLLVVGFFFQDAMDFIIRTQYQDIERQDLRVSLTTERNKKALYDLAHFAGVRRVEPVLLYPFRIRKEWREKDMAITGLPHDAQLFRVLDENRRPVRIEGPGIVLSDQVAKRLAVGPGDKVTVKPLMGRVTKEHDVLVRQVVRQYLGISAYMDLDEASRLLDEPFVMNAGLIRVQAGKERDLSKAFKDVPGITSSEIKSDAVASMKATLEQTNSIVNTFLVGFSGVIAFAIIYNTTLVSLMERQRELASLRVLGFSIAEVGAIMYKENAVLSMVGIGLGIPVGMLLSKLIISVYDTELFQIPFHIEPFTYVRMILAISSFVLLANLAVRRRIRALDMVEVLKTRE